MSRSKDIKIKNKSFYSGSDIEADVKIINRDKNLKDELGIFRLASLHRDLDLANQPPPNAVLVNLRIKFITNADVEVECVIPVMVTQGDDQKALTFYSGSKVDEKEFFKFYNLIKPEVKAIDRQRHYHSEPFLSYYLCSQGGKDFLVREFEKKGLIAVDKDGKYYESNVKEITGIVMDLHSTKVVCFNCGPFLKAAIPHLLKSIKWALCREEDKKLSKIEFNVSANQNFDWSNISRPDTFDHIPVLESGDKNILANTEKILGDARTRLQKVGEASNRTYFLSGSGSIDSDVIALRDLDEKRWKIVATAASIEIQRMWRGFSERKKFKQKQVELKKDELSKVRKEIGEKEDEIESLKKEIDAFKLKLKLVSKIKDLAQRIEDGEIDGKEEVDEIEDLYERATEDGLFEETENSSYDSNSKFAFLLELQDSKESLKRQKDLDISNLDDLEKELEKLRKKQEILEQQIKNLSSVTPSKKSASSSVAKKSTQKVSVDADHEENLDIFNYVGESTNLTHQNVLHLIGVSFELAAVDNSQTAVAVISEDDSLDYCLRDEILKFIGREPAQDKISIALCRGHIDATTEQIGGNTHWTGLHLRKVENADGTISIQAYHMDSMGNLVPSSVKRVLASIKETRLEDLGADLAANEIYRRAIERLENIDFEECQVIECVQQQDYYSCGYHAIFNMLRIHDSDEIDELPEMLTQDGVEVNVDKFIEDRKSDLQAHFNPVISAQLRQHARFSADIDLNRALSESIFISDDNDLDKLKQLIQLENEIKKSSKDPAIALSSLNLEKFYKKLLSHCVEQIRYNFLTTEECEVGDEDSVQKRERILEKLSSSKTAQNPGNFLEILERITKNLVLLSSSLDILLKDIRETEKEQSAEDSLAKSIVTISFAEKVTESRRSSVRER